MHYFDFLSLTSRPERSSLTVVSALCRVPPHCHLLE